MWDVILNSKYEVGNGETKLNNKIIGWETGKDVILVSWKDGKKR